EGHEAQVGMKTASPSTLDLTDACISQEAPSAESGTQRRRDAPLILLPHQNEYVGHIALDIGGSLIKLVYFTKGSSDASSSAGGKLHFVKFESSKIEECMDFMEAKRLHRSNGGNEPMRVKATGGGAFKYAERFKERLGLILEREDEMSCLVEGCNFLLKAVRHEAFMYENQQMIFEETGPDLYPYLLVNIGSGVSMVKVDGEGKYTRVSGTNVGGGTFWGLCRLLTGVNNFDDILTLSSQGDNSNVDMLVGDIYGGRDYTGIGLSANTIASSFGKVINTSMEPSDYNPADIAMSLCRMISYNIGQLAYLNAKRYNLPRIYFGGFFIRGHPYTMDTISFAIQFWSKGEMSAKFLRHEGFLGAVGAYLKVPSLQIFDGSASASEAQACFVERFTVGAPVTGGEVRGPAIGSLSDKVTWVEKFIAAAQPITETAKTEHEQALQQPRLYRSGRSSNKLLSRESPQNSEALLSRLGSQPHISLNVGVLQYTPSSQPFPLLDPRIKYDPSTTDINNDPEEMSYWIEVLMQGIPTVVEKAAASEGNTSDSLRRASTFGRVLDMHLRRLSAEPGAYGQLGLADLFELREECLREFGFEDVYRMDKERENAAALEALPDLLDEVDKLDGPERLLALIQGSLAANIFDWGAKACVDLYQNATILEMYRQARTKLSQRPWHVDNYDAFAAAWFSTSAASDVGDGHRGGAAPKSSPPFKRVLMFVDNAGADIVLGMIPLAREFLRLGAEVIMVANALPAINDITAAELRGVVARAAETCPIIRAARDAAVSTLAAAGGHIPPVAGALPESSMAQELPVARGQSGHATVARPVVRTNPSPRRLLPHATDFEDQPETPTTAARKGMFGESYPSLWKDPRLYIVSSGHGSPCLDLRRVSAEVAEAAVGADLVVIEGMGRALHTNYHTRFRCAALKLAMLKNAHLAERLFGGKVYDCICRYDPAPVQSYLDDAPA
ncbi:hypothetical protein APUTEX25_003693, partial [Auxenochlorella protothecoides]